MDVQSNIKITNIFKISATIIVILMWKQNGISLQPVIGKSAVNGNRGIIKWLTARASFQKPYNNQILSVEAVDLSCSKNAEYILFNFCERDTLNILWDKLAYHYEYGKTVPGTHSYQQLPPVSVDKIDYNKPVKDGNDLAGTFTFKKQ